MAGRVIDRAELARLCYDIFEVDQRGAAIFDAIIARYSKPAVVKGGIDAVLQTYYNMGQRQLLDDLMLLVNEGRDPLPQQPNDEA